MREAFAGSVVVVVAGIIVGLGNSTPVEAKPITPDDRFVVECLVVDNAIAEQLGNTRYRKNNNRAKQRFTHWMFKGNSLKEGRRLLLFWNGKGQTGRRALLRVAIDSRESKRARLISITKDTVIATVTTSDRMTTRIWTFALNFRQQTVMASGISSNFSGMNHQMPTLSCVFHNRNEIDMSRSHLVDMWEECCARK